VQTQKKQIQIDLQIAYQKMQSFLQTESVVFIKDKNMKIISLIDFTETQNLYQSYLESVTKSFESKQKLQKQAWLPNLNFEYFQGRNNGISQSLYGFQVGVSIPILFTEQAAKTKVARLELEQWQLEKEHQSLQISQFIQIQTLEIAKQKEALDYYETYGKKVADEIIKVSESSFKNGEIDFFQYIQSIENATQISMQYAEAVFQYNQAQINLYYLNF
jgi:cobalt-zinc-cadmium resistance protein CzcA